MHYIGNVVTPSYKNGTHIPMESSDVCVPCGSIDDKINKAQTFTKYVEDTTGDPYAGCDCWILHEPTKRDWKICYSDNPDEEIKQSLGANATFSADGWWWEDVEGGYTLNHTIVEQQSADFDAGEARWYWDNEDGTRTYADKDYQIRWRAIDEAYSWECRGGDEEYNISGSDGYVGYASKSQKDTHAGHYCGGHIKLNTTGLVYSFTEEQIDAMGEMINPDAKVYGKVDDKTVDFTSIATAQTSGATPESPYTIGWNVTSKADAGVKDEEIITQINGNSSLAYVNDIFDCDMLIRYNEDKSIL